MEITLSLPMLLFLMLMTGFAGFVDSAAGGGGLISLPAYLFAGLPVHYRHRGKKVPRRTLPDAPLPGVCAEQLHLQLVGAVAGRCAGPLCDRAGPLVRQRQKDRPV